MSIFDIFTGRPAQVAASAQRDLYGNVLGMGLPAIASGQSAALDYLNQGRTGAEAYLNPAIDTSRSDIASSLAQARGDIGASLDPARAALASASGAYTPLANLASQYGLGSTMYANALGLNGPGGTTAAQGAFTTGPAYDFNLQQGLDAINRRRAAGGMLNSGNADRDAQLFGAGLASNEYNNWLNRLQGFQPLQLQATTGAATGQALTARDLANLELGTGMNLANLSATGGRSLSDIALRGGLAGAGIEQGYGTGSAGAIGQGTGQRIGLLGSLIQPYGQTYGEQAAAQQQGSANLWGLGTNLLRTAIGGGGLFGGGGTGATRNSTFGYNPLAGAFNYG